jgi:hypothetical protein
MGIIENRDLAVKYKILKNVYQKGKRVVETKEVIENLRISGTY